MPMICTPLPSVWHKIFSIFFLSIWFLFIFFQYRPLVFCFLAADGKCLFFSFSNSDPLEMFVTNVIAVVARIDRFRCRFVAEWQTHTNSNSVWATVPRAPSSCSCWFGRWCLSFDQRYRWIVYLCVYLKNGLSIECIGLTTWLISFDLLLTFFFCCGIFAYAYLSNVMFRTKQNMRQSNFHFFCRLSANERDEIKNKIENEL